MTEPQYEDTVQPEIAPCVGCGVLVDETNVYGWADDGRLCLDCVDAMAGDEAAQ